MKNILIITWFTLREAMARKVIIFFAGLSIVTLLITFAIIAVTDLNTLLQVQNQTNDPQIFKEIVSSIQLMIVNPLSGLCLLLAIFASSSFVPVMLEKGNIDLLLSKPVSRSQLLWGKYFGGVLVVFLNILFLVAGVWLIISFKFNYWNISFLYSIVIITFTFAVLYSLIVLCGILTKGSMLGMMLSYFIFLILSPLLLVFKEKISVLVDNNIVKTVIDVIYYIVPKTAELLGKINVDLALGKPISDYQPVITSFLFLVACMTSSIWLFNKKDF
jgi:ABC-type transport system involved in multi-copper enzyme maturation permease subunit